MRCTIPLRRRAWPATLGLPDFRFAVLVRSGWSGLASWPGRGGQRLVRRNLCPVVHVGELVPLSARPVAVVIGSLAASLARPHGRQAVLTSLRGTLGATAIVVPGRHSLALAAVGVVALIGIFPRVGPARVTAVATRGPLARAPRLVTRCPPGRLHVAHGAPGACVAVTGSRVAASAGPLVGQIIEVVGIVRLEVMHGGENDDKDQDDNCSQDYQDRGHRTIQGGMA